MPVPVGLSQVFVHASANLVALASNCCPGDPEKHKSKSCIGSLIEFSRQKVNQNTPIFDQTNYSGSLFF